MCANILSPTPWFLLEKRSGWSVMVEASQVGTVNVGGIARQRRRHKNENNSLLLVPSVLQGLVLGCRAPALVTGPVSTILPSFWVGLILCLPFPYVILNSFRWLSCRSKGFLWEMTGRNMLVEVVSFPVVLGPWGSEESQQL